MGVEKKVDVSNLSEQQVGQKVEELLRAGDALPKSGAAVVQ